MESRIQDLEWPIHFIQKRKCVCSPKIFVFCGEKIYWPGGSGSSCLCLDNCHPYQLYRGITERTIWSFPDNLSRWSDTGNVILKCFQIRWCEVLRSYMSVGHKFANFFLFIIISFPTAKTPITPLKVSLYQLTSLHVSYFLKHQYPNHS